MHTLLVLCTGNSCRSIIGEALLNQLGTSRVKAYSAGSHPIGRVNPNALAVLKKNGIATMGFFSKSWDVLQGEPIDVVITVCDQAAGETCPAYLGAALKVYWRLPDPAVVSGSEQTVKAAFQATFDALELRVDRFLELPLGELSQQDLVDRCNEIGKIEL